MEVVFALSSAAVIGIVVGALLVCAALMAVIFRGSRGEQVIEHEQDVRLEEGIGGDPVDLDAEFKPPREQY